MHTPAKPTWPAATRYWLIAAVFWVAVACNSGKDNTGIAPQPQASTVDATVALKWMDLFLVIDRYAPGYRPPVAARALAYIHLAGYESIVPLSVHYQSIAGSFTGLTVPRIETGKTYLPEAALNTAYHTMFRAFFPTVAATYSTKIDSLYQALDVQYAKASADDVTRSKQFGMAVANAVFAWSKTDAAGDAAYLRNQPTDYTVPVGPGKWQPTAPDFGRALLPYWGQVRTFVANSVDRVARPPIAYNTAITSPMYAQALEVYSLSKPLSYDDRWIGEFWSDDIFELTCEPAGRWIATANQVIRQDKVSLEKAVYTYVKVGLALSDVGVACWGSKYIYSIERPISFIRRTIDPTWTSALNNPLKKVQGLTPSFPSYPSGHSCFGAAAAEVLTAIYGQNYTLTDRCHEGRTEFNGTPRTFASFYDMATENAYSRVYLGVHYRMDCDEGLRMGYVIGRKVNQLAWEKK